MVDTNKIFELAGAVRQIKSRLVLHFDQESSQKLPSRGQVAVRLVDSDQSVVLEPDGRRGHWLPAEQLDLELGQNTILKVAIADRWPEVTLPEDLAGALAEASDLQDTWDGLTPMARWEWARWVESTKNTSTRERRVEVSISKLRDGKRRPCCFDLSSCTDPEVAKSGKLID
ncbi:YdeI/OmpD-associated family protein [Glutamicibacter arilaitensis]|uniref:YdeI/OmpD-associated family protein n=1 Tax=Glutamicibacter arilaitensis TaxID=256701 RepID=UPI00384FCE68